MERHFYVHLREQYVASSVLFYCSPVHTRTVFTAVVVENFSSVQSKASTINREEMRLFKRAWGEIDLERTGFIKRKDYGRFFAVRVRAKHMPRSSGTHVQLLSGVFEVKVYPDEYRIPAILAASRRQTASDPPRSPSGKIAPTLAKISDETLDLAMLKKQVKAIDQADIARRRRRYSRLYFEAILSDDPKRGMSFTNMLLLLAHYKLINDDKALQCVRRPALLRPASHEYAQARRAATATGENAPSRRRRSSRPCTWTAADDSLAEEVLAAYGRAAAEGRRGCVSLLGCGG